MPKHLINEAEIVGRRYGRLTVLSRAPNGKNYLAMFTCRCKCGTERAFSWQGLRNGKVQSCGCYLEQNRHRLHLRHGGHKSREFETWARMRQRCENPNNPAYHRYGGRGIRVCERWQIFENFIADMGRRPTDGTIERDNINGNYEPGNCRWATWREQQNNRSNNRALTLGGKTQNLQRWADEIGIRRETIANRIRLGWSVEMALTKPLRGAT